MTDIVAVTRSLRAVRLYARVPRLVAGLLALILIAAGVRATVAGPANPLPTPRVAPVTSADQGAAAFAEGFVHAYLSWDAGKLDDRNKRLNPYVGALEDDAGLQPDRATSQHVIWTAVVGERRDAQTRLITVAAQTTNALVYLSVPVSRDRRSFLSIDGYPALVGPPATASASSRPPETQVDDDPLIDVVTRALGNYLARNRQNLLADLAPDAVVSPPSVALAVTDKNPGVTWVVPSRRVAVEIEARDGRKTAWTLRYELDVRKRDRWYVQSIHVDPTFRATR